ncbi:MAG: hypothetical protein JO112_00160 [Planctomycetes bacterium]|nr:hypothetical protein [Planctomycetota bacterium]
MVRNAYLLLMTSTLSFTGCSLLIARSGMDLQTLTTREEVHHKFGPPLATGTIDGHPFEDFHTRRKISEPERSAGWSMGLAMTWGLVEFYLFPHEVYLLGRRTFLGQDIRFTYDSAGKVATVFLEGEKFWFPKSPEHPEPASEIHH